MLAGQKIYTIFTHKSIDNSSNVCYNKYNERDKKGSKNMKYDIIINGTKKFTSDTKKPHGAMRNYLIECQLNGDKVEIVEK